MAPVAPVPLPAARLDDPEVALDSLRRRRDRLEQDQDELVRRLRDGGWSWDALAASLGANRETLRRRYGGAAAASSTRAARV